METFFFVLSKTLGVVAQPLNWAFAGALGTAAALFAQRWRLATSLLLATIAVFLVTGWAAPAELVLRRLEDSEPRAAFEPGRYRGVVVLGGAIETDVRSIGRRDVMLNAGAERVTSAVALARHDPALELVFTGFSGQLLSPGRSEADAARQFFEEQGLDASRLRFEGRSRNTWENALYTSELPGIDRTQPWLLLTSAAHMPRSIAIFRKLGWNVAPYPVDYRSSDHVRWLTFHLGESSELWEVALHEMIGIAVYRLTGRL